MDSSKINIGAPSRKKIRDAERQEELKEKIAMLKNLVVKDLDQKMSQLDVLKATHKAALKIKNISASGPYCRGFYDGVENIESLVISYIKSLYMNKTKKASQISKIRKFFELKKDKTAEPADIPRNQSGSTSEDTASDSFAGANVVDMKQIRRQREQNRRDCHTEGYSLLRQFIHENGLCDYSSLHRTQILDVMIGYISQANTVTLPDSPVQLKLYLDGLENGKTVGKASVISFFKTDSFLMNQSAAFQTFLELHLGPSSSSTPSSPAPIAPHVQFNPFLIYQLPLFNLSKTFIFTVTDHVQTILDGILRRLSSWIGIVMASIRCFAIKNPLNPTTDNLSKLVFAIESIFLLGTLSAIVLMSYWCHFWIDEVAEWVPGEECGYPVNFTTSISGSIQSEFSIDHPLSLQIPQTADGVSQIIPALALPILTILLIKKLRRTESKRNKVLASKTKSSTQTDHTTKMITIMTVASTFSEGPIGLILIVQVFAGPSVTTITANRNVIFGAIVALNTITHCLVCIVISSQYRKTMLEIFMCRRSKSRVTPNGSVITLKRGA